MATLSDINTTIETLRGMGVKDSDPNLKKLLEERDALLDQGKSGPVSIYDYMKVNTPYTPELQKRIEQTVDCLINPKNSNEDTSIPGLLLGRIQSGKTRAFIGVMALAFDKGFDACIVLTKPDNGLVAQTKSRLENEFEHFADDTNAYDQNIVAIYDVNRLTVLTPRQLRFKSIFVLHKNVRLDTMKRILDDSFSGKKVLIIDDEADFVSRTFYSRRQQITAGVTGFRIDELTSNPQIDCYYLQVTATPYSLLLQPNDVIDVDNGTMSCFRPRFTVLVPTHDSYVGGKEYYEDSKDPSSMYSLLFNPISDQCFDYMLSGNADNRITGQPQTHKVFRGLRFALAKYFVASAIRQIQENRKTHRAYKTSMLIHCAIEKDDHNHEQKIVNKILNYWQSNIAKNTWVNLTEIIAAYHDFKVSISLGIKSSLLDRNTYIPKFKDILNKLKDIFNQIEYTVKCVNGNTTDDPNMYTTTGQLKLTNLLNIFIGGYKADRGITIDHMIAFVYGRRPQNGGQANTMLQHMRQYGNRSKEDMAVTRFYTTLVLHQRLEDIYHTDETLRGIFENNASPDTVCIEINPNGGYRLCSPNQVRMSDMYGFGAFSRLIATGGMQTKVGIEGHIQRIKNELIAYTSKPNEPFKLSKDKAIEWIKTIRDTFIYNNSRYENKGINWDEEIMIAAIEKYCPQDNEIWCYYRLNQGISRKTSSGFSDSPDDGNTDGPLAKRTAIDRPILLLLGERGETVNGWRGKPFFWPVLRLPQNVKNSVFCHGVVGAPRAKSRIQVTLSDGSILQEAKVHETMIKCIQIAGPDKVRALGLPYRKNNLVHQAGRKPKDFEVITPGKYYLRKGIPTQRVQEFLIDISNQLCLGWSVRII